MTREQWYEAWRYWRQYHGYTAASDADPKPINRATGRGKWWEKLPSAGRRRWLAIQQDKFLAQIEPGWTPPTGVSKTPRLHVRWILQTWGRQTPTRLP